MNFPPGWQLPDAITSRLGQSSGRQRAIIEEGHLLLVLHKVPSASTADREGVFFWRKPEGEWLSSGGKHGIVTLMGHLQEYDVAIDALEKRYAGANTARQYFEILEAIVPLHRASSNQYAALQTARETLAEAQDLITPRDAASDIDRAADLLHTDAKHGLEYRMAEQGEQQAQAAHEMSQTGHRLNLMAALFLPTSVIAGAFGSSLRSGLENSEPVVFWTLLVLSLVAGALLYFFMSGKTRR